MPSSDISRASSRRSESTVRHRYSSRSPESRSARDGSHGEISRKESRDSYRSSGASHCRDGDRNRYTSREPDEERDSRDRSHSSRKPVGRMRGWGDSDTSSSSGTSSSTTKASGRSGAKISSRVSERERESREDNRRFSSSNRSRSRDRNSPGRAQSRTSAKQRSRSSSRHRDDVSSSRHRDDVSSSRHREDLSTAKHREDDRTRPFSRTDSRRVDSTKARHSPPRDTTSSSNNSSSSSRSSSNSSSNSSSSSSSSSQVRRSDSRRRDSPAAERHEEAGASRRERPQGEASAKGQHQQQQQRPKEQPTESRAPASLGGLNGVAPAKRSLSPSRSSSSSSLKDDSGAAAPASKGGDSASGVKQESAAAGENKSSSSDKTSRLERFRALKRQKQLPEKSTSSGDTASQKDRDTASADSSNSSSAFKDWLPPTPNVKFAVGSSSSNKMAATATPSAGATATSAAAAAAAVAAAQAVASAALAAAGLASASAATVSTAGENGLQKQAAEGATGVSPNEGQGQPSPAAAAADSGSAPTSPPAGETDGGRGVMKPPKQMSRNRLKKHQQAQLLKQLQNKTVGTAPEAQGDADLLDAFMSALEAEAKDELSAAKAEDTGEVEALGCITSRGSQPPRPQSISLEEISRWQEVEATYLPPGAVAKATPPATPGGAAASPTTATAPESAESLADGTKVEPAAEGTGCSSAATLPPTSDVSRVKREPTGGATDVPPAGVAEPASSGPAATATASSGAAPTAASSAGAAQGVKAEGGQSQETAAVTPKQPEKTAAADEVDPEDAKYHELFLETLRKGRLKGRPDSGGSTHGKGKGTASDEDEVEEEEVIIYSDHEEAEEEAAQAAQAAQAAAGKAEGTDSGKGKDDDDNGTQAKEQLANLSYFDLVKRVGLKKELPLVDHASCKFPPIKKNLYVQVKELTDLKDHEVEAIRKTNGNIKVRGKQCPRPVSSFHQCGLPEKILRHLEARGFEKPFPVQSQCIPILMCGRDLIAVAETGSGKTLAYTLPLVRHVLSVKRQYKEYLAKQKEEKLLRLQQQEENQQLQEGKDEKADAAAVVTDKASDPQAKAKPRGQQQAVDNEDRDRYRRNEKGERMLIYGNFKEGMIGLVIAPTRELSLQISKEVSRMCKLVDLNVASLYGGAGIGGQLGQIRRGVDVVVGTPGRLIDVLTLNSCKFTSLKRVTFVVLDEADRMFDYGFEPQISSILRSTRLDRQTCLFSATFPSHIESLARRILYKPIEVVVGEKGRTAAKVQQYVEVMDEERKFYRLLQLLGDWQDYGSIIIFVNKQIEADELFAELLKYGYQALVLHGGQDQTDREFTIQEFKDGTKTLLIATSVAARGLDVPSVVLVINFCCPSHIEDYVHRIGRTGRAGNIGVAYTFITPQEADKAEELEGALIQSGQTVPPALAALSSEFRVQCNMGLAQKNKRGGFGGKGFTFSITEKSRQQQQMQQAKKELSGANDFDEVEEVELLLQRDDFSPPTTNNNSQLALTNTMSTMDAAMAAAAAAAAARGGGAGATSGSLQSAVEAAAAKAALLVKHQLAGGDNITQPTSSTEGVARVKLIAKILKLQDAELAKRPPSTPPAPPEGLPPPGSEKTKLTADQQVDFMLQQALKGLPEADQAQYKDKLREAYKKHLSPRPKVQQKAAPGMQLALASSVTGQALPKEKDPFMDAAAEALAILKQGTTASSNQLQAALDKIKAFNDSAELAAAISSVSAPSNPTLGKVPGLSDRGFVCPETGNFVDELEINDYPQVARYKITQKELMSRIMEETGAVLYVKGQHVEPALKHRTQLAPGVKFLHVEIIAPTPIQVQRARHAVYELVESIALKSLNLNSSQRQAVGRYSVV